MLCNAKLRNWNMKVLKLHWLCTEVPKLKCKCLLSQFYLVSFSGTADVNYGRKIIDNCSADLLNTGSCLLHMLLSILQWFLSQTQTRHFEVIKNMAAIIYNFFSPAPYLPFTIHFKYKQNSQSWPEGPDCTQELTGTLTSKQPWMS